MMKKILYSLSLVVAILFSSCEQNVIYEDTLRYSDFCMVTSLSQNISNSAVRQDGVEVGEIVYFMDCSTGLASRKWELISEDGYFLDDSFVDGGADLDYTPYYLETRTLTDHLVYVQQSIRGEVKLRYTGSFYFSAKYLIYDDFNVEQSIYSVYNEETGLWDLTVDYDYYIYEIMDVAYVIYPSDEPENIIYYYAHSDEHDPDYTLYLDPNTTYTLELKEVYGIPTVWTWSKSEFADYSNMTTVEFTTGNSGTTYNLGNIVLTRSGNTVPAANVTVDLVECSVL